MPMDDLTLKSIISSQITGATSYRDSEIAGEQERLLEIYRAKPYGDEGAELSPAPNPETTSPIPETTTEESA